MIETLQSLLRRAFMAAEALFNRAFGDRLNPYYHLGAIGFWLFWIVVATGVYLFVFFDTSVGGAYRSVQSLTHDQWFAGGLLRSVHRYASDTLVVTMVIHMARHFAFNRMRGFRALSWLTGVALIALVYAAGANGYMLPWDRLAQFVTSASFEWLDGLPIFGGTLSRNFVYAASVSDRLFSLLVFIHIGVPLLVLLLMWVHVQRVPKASTQPPRAIAIGVAVMLLVLAAVLPATSQGGAAQLDVAPTMLQIDWFLLAPYPLADSASPGIVWAFVVGAAVLLLALPWIPWRRAGALAAPAQITFQPGSRHVVARRGETLLEAGLRAGLALDYDCRSGGCGRCLCTVLNGRVDAGAYQPAALSAALRARGGSLMCCAVALEDVEIEVGGPQAAPQVEVFDGEVVRMDRLAPDVMRLMIALPGGRRLDFVAGQYLDVVLDDDQRRAFSFANPPHDNALIELHVRLIPGGRFTTEVFTRLKVGDRLRLEGPKGSFRLHDSDRPILFVAGATGFAPVKSIVEDAFARGIRRPMQLYWGVRRAHDLYLLDLARSWEREHPNFSVVPVLSESSADDRWTGRRGLVQDALLADHSDLGDCEIYACGSQQMVNAAVPAFLDRGLAETQCFSDAFVPAGARSDGADTRAGA